MDLNLHADQSTRIRQAADYASGLADNLRKLNSGPVFDHDREKLVEGVNIWFDRLAELLGKKGEAA
ncbi:hypothetical protein B5M44_03935 [Shinella sumterensis]|uniref:hypothetical protein n=1 Tax=Shinella sumterensis TaxID=1967501 RepID=UPI00106E5D32|nr:hypothetical protein [Shinella sumterensis]MCD1264106.1 hypothetical protein [Shinella sumterensis]TFE99364.1 hypothetical protein B5M44_03935 [Shinella sumterensis]